MTQPRGAAAAAGRGWTEAETWYRRAANAGHGEAMHNLGVLLQQRGRLDEAETWYRRAAQAGHSEAMHKLGELVRLRGELGEAETWYRRAAAAGHTEAMFNLGARLAERGKWDEAATWYRRAADAGHAEAMFTLGWLLQHFNLGEVLQQLGELVEAEIDAETWYRRAAEAGHAEAMTKLGKEVIYRREDLSEAETWYRRAAEAGEAGDEQSGAAGRVPARRARRGADLVPAGGRGRPQRGDVQLGGAAARPGRVR